MGRATSGRAWPLGRAWLATDRGHPCPSAEPAWPCHPGQTSGAPRASGWACWTLFPQAPQAPPRPSTWRCPGPAGHLIPHLCPPGTPSSGIRDPLVSHMAQDGRLLATFRWALSHGPGVLGWEQRP